MEFKPIETQEQFDEMVKNPGAHDTNKQTGADDSYESAKRKLAKAMFGGTSE